MRSADVLAALQQYTGTRSARVLAATRGHAELRLAKVFAAPQRIAGLRSARVLAAPRWITVARCAEVHASSAAVESTAEKGAADATNARLGARVAARQWSAEVLATR